MKVPTLLELLKTSITYLTAATAALGGIVAIFLTRSDPSATDTRVVIAGFVGSAFTFLYSQSVSTQTAKQSTDTTVAATTVAAATTAAAVQATANGTSHNSSQQTDPPSNPSGPSSPVS